MQLNVIFMIQKWLVTGVLVLVASISNAQTYVIEFLNESAGASTTPVSIFELPPPWSEASQAVGATVGVGNNKNESYAKLGVRVRTTANALIAGVQVTRVSCTAEPAAYLIGSFDAPVQVTDSGGIAHFRLRGQQMVKPFATRVREINCGY